MGSFLFTKYLQIIYTTITFKEGTKLATAKEIADFSEKYIGDDLKGYRKSFLELVLKTLSLKS